MCRTLFDPLDPVRAESLIAGMLLEEKRTLRRPSQAQWRTFVHGLFASLSDVTDRLAAKVIEAKAWYDETRARIEEGHVRATTLGRNRAGDLAADPLLDELAGRRAMRSQDPFLARFHADIAGGLYDDPDTGALRTAPIKQRQELYVQRTRGTANEAFVGVSGDQRFDWVMLAAEHCEDCPRISAGSPYTGATLPSRPGDGATQCVVNCGCVLVRYDGVIGFARETNTGL